MLPRHIPPRRPSELKEKVQSLGIFAVVLLGAIGLGVLWLALAFVLGALGL